MRGWLLLMLVACGHPATTNPPPHAPSPTVMRLRPPPALDLDGRGSTYLAAVALQLQPGWGQFLDDCRLRLPATHPLNDFSLAATAELAIDARGQIGEVRIVGSGNDDFDRAVRDALGDVNPLPAPPKDLWSDDDRVHLRWLFARDRRQAGPATAAVVDLELPLDGVVARLVRERDLSRAARRIMHAKPGDARDAATRVLAVAVLREGLEASDTTVRRAAVEAIRRAGVAELAPEVRALLALNGDSALRELAARTLAELHDTEAAPMLLTLLDHDLVESEPLAATEVRALVALDRERDVATLLRGALLTRNGDPHPIALAVSGLVAMPELSAHIGSWVRSKNATTRAAACGALHGFASADAKKWLLVGMSDRDASVRAACLDAVRDPLSVRTKLRTLAKDRDVTTRAAAVALLAKLPDEVVPVVDDPAAQVRAAYAAAATPKHGDIDALRIDRDPDVRAAAWQTYVRGDSPMLKTEARDAANDPSPQVRRASIPALDDDETIARLARDDVDGDVRTDALVRYATRRGREAVADMLLTSVAAAAPGTRERVRACLAWLLAR